MAQFIVRDLEDTVKARLKRRAERHGRSMEEEVRDILRNAAKEENRPLPNLGSRIAAHFAKTGLSDDLPELRGQAPRPAEIGKRSSAIPRSRGSRWRGMRRWPRATRGILQISRST